LKKTLTILLLAVHLFNVCGYRLFFSFEEAFANRQMIAALDKNNYDESELLQIRVPLNTPYITGNRSYERCDGQVEFNGIQYNYVNRMVQNDTLYLYCIPNKQKTEISNTKNLYAKQNSDNPTGKTTGQSVLKKINFSSEYNSRGFGFNSVVYSFSAHQTIAFNNLTTLKGFARKHLQPPDLFI
jgi:hypothetical protein